jgi:hypothetical protein
MRRRSRAVHLNGQNPARRPAIKMPRMANLAQVIFLPGTIFDAIAAAHVASA